MLLTAWVQGGEVIKSAKTDRPRWIKVPAIACGAARV
jgi:hypothetical protein